MNVAAHTYVLHLSCPVCGNKLHHVASIEPLCDTIGARAECRHCDTDVTVTVEMSYKRRHTRGPLRQNRLPLQPLLAVMHCGTYNELGCMIGMSRLTIQRYATEGIPLHKADEMAVMCGVHPMAVWGDDFLQTLEREP